MRAAEWPSLKHQPPMPLFFLAPEYQSTVRHTKPQQDETTTHMNSKLPNAQETTCRQLCLVTVSKEKRDKEGSRINNLGLDEGRHGPLTDSQVPEAIPLQEAAQTGP
jgi:hypothetical protein